MDDDKTVQAIAFRLLEEIYKRTAKTGHPVHSNQLAATIGSTEQEAIAGWRYLKQKEVISTHGSNASSGPASVNDKGIDIVENARRHPNDPIPAFGGSITYNNTFHIHQMTGGGIQVAGAHSTQHQTITYNSKDLVDLQQAIEILSQRIDELNLDAATKNNALAQVDTIKAQLSADKPIPTILTEAGRSLRNITEGAISELIAKGVIDYWPVVRDVLTRMFGAS
jgi:hypothetical protein